MNEFALYTTIYPGVERFLADWYRSVLEQSDQDFDLVIGVDGVDLSAVIKALRESPRATWVPAAAGASPAQVRQNAFEMIARAYQAVVFVDSDDILMPQRVAAARQMLETYDVVASAMLLVDEDGGALNFIFNMPSGEDPTEWLLRGNVFGLSNTAYRTKVLEYCLPVPFNCILVDWYLATRSWLSGARLGFDPSIQMAYRQHGQNMASPLPPFTPARILAATRYVRQHYATMLQVIQPGDLRRVDFEKMYNHIGEFYGTIHSRTDVLERYTAALNQLPGRSVWWACVAHPELEELWRS